MNDDMPRRGSLIGMALRTKYAVIGFAAVCSAGLVYAQSIPEPASPRHDIQFYRIAKGFQPEVMNANGMARGTGFAKPNRWGQYTAYLMAKDRAGKRTWRIEHYLPFKDQNTAQGSTMYLLEGGDRALLIDTANPAAFTPGVNDLKTVVRYLLGHDDQGRPKPHPLDFVVANTHSHGDHIGENVLMSDRTVYYMDGDWPEKAPANYVPVREGGGATPHGDRVAVKEIDLGGGRILKAVAIPPHTPGSTGYLDTTNRMLFTGDAVGSAWPWLQWVSIADYGRSIHHLEELTRGYPDLLVLPGHFYQIRMFGRAGAPLNGRPLDRQYIVDQVGLADGLLAGSIVGEPYPWQHSGMWAQNGTAKLVYSLDHLAEHGEDLPTAYHAVQIPGGYRREWTATSPTPGQDIERLSDIKADIYLVRQQGGPTLYLIRGSSAALLIGTGTGAPELAGTIARLSAGLPLDVAILDSSREQTGGLAQLSPRHVYAAEGTSDRTVLHDGETISLGQDRAGRPLELEAQMFRSGPQPDLTLRIVADRVLFAGNVLGRTAAPDDLRAADIFPFKITDPIAYQVALSDWSSRTIGRYDGLYVSGSADWFLSPNYVVELQQALSTANTGKGPARKDAGVSSGTMIYRSTGANDVRAVIEVPEGRPSLITVSH